VRATAQMDHSGLTGLEVEILQLQALRATGETRHCREAGQEVEPLEVALMYVCVLVGTTEAHCARFCGRTDVYIRGRGLTFVRFRLGNISSKVVHTSTVPHCTHSTFRCPQRSEAWPGLVESE